METIFSSELKFDLTTILMAEQMFREECYYLTKLSMVSEIDTTECNPTEPRVEG